MKIINKIYKNKDWLYQKYIVEKLSIRKIARICYCDHTVIHHWLKKYNINRRNISETNSIRYIEKDSAMKRFFQKVGKKSKNGCWCVNSVSAGYPHISVDGKIIKIHRFSWEIFNNEILTNDFVAHHKCGNKTCCNPEHLEKMKIFDHNSLHKSCENSPTTKLTNNQVKQIRNKYKTKKYTRKELSIEYDVSIAIISHIVTNRTWKT